MLELVKKNLFKSANTLGRVNRIVSEIRKLKKLEGKLSSYKEIKKELLSKEVVAVIEAK